jgi:hypothetical protein
MNGTSTPGTDISTGTTNAAATKKDRKKKECQEGLVEDVALTKALAEAVCPVKCPACPVYPACLVCPGSRLKGSSCVEVIRRHGECPERENM